MLLFILLAIFLPIINGQSSGDIRLAGPQGRKPYEGRVEVFHLGLWGTICDDQFDMNDANVICRQLGYTEGAKEALTAGHKFGAGTGNIWVDGLRCTGAESKLKDCKSNMWGIHDCLHREDAGVICKHTPATPPPITVSSNFSTNRTVRIVCPSSAYRFGTCRTCAIRDGCPNENTSLPAIGVVERLVGNSWHPIPADGWDQNAAKVVCGQLGYPVADPIPGLQKIFPVKQCARPPKNATRCAAIQSFRSRLGLTITKGLICTGSEQKIESCYVTSYKTQPNPLLQVATISCSFGEEANSETCGDPGNETYRLRGGSVPWIGRVEIRRNGKWGTICDLGWNMKAAHIVCRNLGFGVAKNIFSRSKFGRGSSETHFSGLNCKGSESVLSECPRTSDNKLKSQVNTYCHQHSGDAGVECTIPENACRNPAESRITGSGVSTFVEVYGINKWGRLCFDGQINYNVAHVICRESSEKLAARFLPIKDAGYSGVAYHGQFRCTGDELNLSECSLKTLSPVSSCANYTRIDCVTGLPDLVPNLARFEQSLRYYPHLDYIPMYYLSCALEENCLASDAHGKPVNHLRALLRFDSLTMNLGTSQFLPNLQPHQWEWHACHQHYHSFEAFINYDILDLQGRKVAEGHKASFCLEDSLCHSGGYNTFRCSTGVQGISVNCGDLYARHLDCQWIDITGLQNGTYIVRQIVNKDHLVGESCYKNNIIQCMINLIPVYGGQRLQTQVIRCSHSDH